MPMPFVITISRRVTVHFRSARGENCSGMVSGQRPAVANKLSAHHTGE